jgi:hypothetical protein
MQNILVYSAAIALDPRFKWTYLEAQEFHQPVIEVLKKQVRELWETEYKSADMLPQSTTPKKGGFIANWVQASKGVQKSSIVDASPAKLPARPTRGTRSGKSSNPLVPAAPAPPSVLDEYEKWCREPPDDTIEDMFAFWQAKRGVYPHLFIMAMEIFLVNAMSAEVERIFSQAMYTISDCRASLLPDIIEACACLHHWHAEHQVFFLSGRAFLFPPALPLALPFLPRPRYLLLRLFSRPR